MAYPTTPATFPTRNPLDIVHAADLNAYGGEIEAVEAGWLKTYGQTLAPFRVRGANPCLEFGDGVAAGGGSTLAYNSNDGTGYIGLNCEPGTTANTFKTRGVPGAAMSAGATYSFQGLAVFTAAADNQAAASSAQATSTGCFQFPGNPVCRLRNTTALSVSSGALAALAFDTEDADAFAFHATGSASVVIPGSYAGWYLITASTRFQAAVTGYRGIYLHLNGTAICIVQHRNCGASFSCNVSLTWLHQLAGGDTVDLRVRHNAGVALLVGDTVREQHSQLALARISS